MNYLKRDDRSELLLTATVNIMREVGFIATTARRIAQRSDSAIGNINRVFGSLQALKRQAFITITLQVADACYQRASALPAREALLAMLGDPVESHQEIEVHLWREVAILAEQDETLRPMYTEALGKWQAAVSDVIHDGIRQRVFHCKDTPPQTAWRLIASALGMDTLIRFGTLQPASEYARLALLHLIDLELCNQTTLLPQE